jgi:hypothetical protein
MRIKLPDGEELIPDSEFRKEAGDVTERTGRNWDQLGCPFVYIANRKYRPHNRALNWIASRIRERNPRRA